MRTPAPIRLPDFFRFAQGLFPQSGLQAVLLPIISPEKWQSDPKDAVTQHVQLHPTEEETLSRLNLPKRRAEWLSGRIAARLAISNHLQKKKLPSISQYLAHLVLDSDENGRPRLAGWVPAVLEGYDISISHSRDLAAALLSRFSCGIDVQYVVPSLVKVASQFCSQPERSLLQERLFSVNELAQLALLWSAKEACRKAVLQQPLVGFRELLLADLHVHQENQIHLRILNHSHSVPLHLDIAATIYQEYALAICTTEVNTHA